MSRMFVFIRNIKLRKKILILSLMISLIPLIIISIYFYNEMIDKQREQLKKGYKSTVDQVTLVIDETLLKHEMLLTYISVNTSLNKVLSYPNMEYLDVTRNMTDVVEPSLYYYILASNVYIKDIKIYSELRDKKLGAFVYPKSSFFDEKIYSNFKENKFTWYVHENNLYLAKKIVNEKYGKTIGYIVADIDYNKLFDEMIESIDDNFMIYDTKNNVVFSNKNKIDSEQKYISIESTIDRLDWKFKFLISEKELYDYSNEALKVNLIVLIILATVIIELSYLFSKSITQPIEELSEKMKQLGKGNFNVDVSCERKDEIGVLNRRFETLTKEIDDLIHKVYKSELNEKEMKILALRAQINPHFLYNILSMINWKAKYANVPEISEIVGFISNYYRTSLNSGKDHIMVKEEIENIKNYMRLKNMLSEERFEYEVNLPEDLEEIKVPTFILQPIIENSIVHGFADIKNIGKIEIFVIREGENIVFKISDNGCGIENIESIFLSDSDSYGLKNVHERIKLKFGKEYGIKLESSIGSGTTVYIRIGNIGLAR